MAFLAMIQQACKRVGLTAPTAAVGSTDENILRMVAIANEEGEELSSGYPWQVLTNEATFSTAATESQGAMTTLAGASFRYIKEETMWNRSQNRPCIPVSDVAWQQMKSNSVTGPYSSYRIRGGNLIFIPVPTASQTVAFEWISKNWCQSSGAAGQSAWTADTDTGILDEQLMVSGIVWRFKKTKGLEYAEDFKEYQIRVGNATAQDGARGRISLGSNRLSRFLNRQSINEGSWTL